MSHVSYECFSYQMNESCLVCMSHDSYEWVMSRLTRIHIICDMTRSYVTWLIHMWHDSFICDMTHSYVICAMAHMCHVLHESTYESWHISESSACDDVRYVTLRHVTWLILIHAGRDMTHSLVAYLNESHSAANAHSLGESCLKYDWHLHESCLTSVCVRWLI